MEGNPVLAVIYKRWMNYSREIFCLTLVLVISGCVPTDGRTLASANVVTALNGAVDSNFARAYKPMPFTFPSDHGAHPEYRTEWWYYTGNLIDAGGNRFGYQLTFFRSALTPELPDRPSDLATNQIYMAHFAITDVSAQQHQSSERYSRGAGGLAGAIGEPTYRVWLDDWSVHEVEPGVTRLQAAVETAEGLLALDLTLRQTGAPVLHGDAGLSQKGPEAGNASYYYSLVQIKTSGTVTLSGKITEVTGVSWMDHEFGTSALSKNAVGWDWFSVQLENGMALMFAQVRTKERGVLDAFTGTLVLPDGKQQTITTNDFVVETLDQWTSPRTGILYPSVWHVTLPPFDLALTLTPLVQDQEMQVSFVYWEGAVAVKATVGGEIVQGVGYVELTGYGQPQGEFQR